MSLGVDIIKLVQMGLETNMCSVEIEGTTELGDGFIGDVKFVKVIYDEPKENSKELHLVVKLSKPDMKLQEMVGNVHQIEEFFFNAIVPIFRKFLEDKNVKTFSVFPKCYKAFSTDNEHVIILENLKKQGFETHARTVPMNIPHLKATLKQYAQYHAISFALKDQRKDVFKTIEEKLPDNRSSYFTKYENLLNGCVERAIQVLNGNGRTDLAEKLQKMLNEGIGKTVEELYRDIPEAAVLLHGDTNSNNYLFRYKDGSRESPSSVVIIDYQGIEIDSPIQDISSFLYAGGSKEGFAHLEELLKCYYNELSTFITQLGSDPDKLFPESTMWEHWKKYSLPSFIGGLFVLEIFNADGISSLVEVLDEKNIKISDKNKAQYSERVIAMTEFFFRFYDTTV